MTPALEALTEALLDYTPPLPGPSPGSLDEPHENPILHADYCTYHRIAGRTR